ncbi:MAG: methionyl-tRNA formyltransferase [Gammaproteobacteria bacterium]|nr:methionyl-tRNA formyltransferase [Gammaproteobacteria bacterium]
MPPLDIVFAGTPEFAAKHLESLIGGHHRLIAVYTQPDRKAGRGKKLLPSPVKTLAEKHGIPVKQPTTLRETSAQEELSTLQADLLIVVAYGLILPQAILTIPRLGCINVHASLLPRWRGAAPIERALLAGDQETGVTIMQMDAGLDTGDMLLRKAVPINDNDTRLSLEHKLAAAGVEALAYVLDHIAEVQSSASPQDDQQSSYASKLEKEEACINWQDNAEQIDRQVRAGIGRNPAYCYMGNERMRVLAATPTEPCSAKAGEIVSVDKSGLLVGCGEGGLLITQIQLAGKNPVSIKDLLNARPEFFKPGALLKSAVAAS